MILFEPKIAKNQGIKRDERAKESGSAIVWILVMIALFAALSYAISDGTRGGTAQLTAQQADLAATEILDYASSIKRAVQELQINGCSDTEVSFDNAFVSGYSHNNAPSDNSCHVFHPNGGGLSYTKPHINNLDSSQSGNANYGDWLTSGSVAITDLNSTDTDLTLYLPYLKSDICSALNKKINITDPIPVDSFTADKFIGSYTPSVDPNIGDDDTKLENQSSFCARVGATSWYYFGQVLIAR